MGKPKRLALGERYQKAWENYLNYLANYDERPDKVWQGTPKPPQTDLYVRPFGINFDVNNLFEVRGTAERWTSFGASFNTYTKDTLDGAGGDLGLKIRGFKPARLVIKTGVSQNGTRKVSERTKLPYNSYGGTSGSVPFGASSAADQELEVYLVVKAAVEGTGGFNAQTTKLSRIKEKI